MNWRDEILSGLPSPRDDEPASLRRDIEDELADHLHCAMQRERTATDDEQAARRAVLARFGNPRRVAYRLWFDAMKEKIMKDRLMLGAVALLTLASLAALALAWTALQQSRTANAMLLGKLEAISTRLEERSIPPHQSILNLTASIDGPGGAPAGGFRFYLQGKLDGAKDEDVLNTWITLGPDGRSRQTLRPGQYTLHYPSMNYPNTGFGPEPCGAYSYRTGFMLYGGEATSLNIHVPASEASDKPAPVAVSFEWPRDLARLIKNGTGASSSSHYLIGCWITRDPANQVLGRVGDRSGWTSNIIELCLAETGEVIPGAALGWDPHNEIANWSTPVYYRGSRSSPQSQVQINDLAKAPRVRELQLHQGKYQILALAVRRYREGATSADSFGSQTSNASFAWHEAFKQPPTFEVREHGQNRFRFELTEKIKQEMARSFAPETDYELKAGERALFHDLIFQIGYTQPNLVQIQSWRFDAPNQMNAPFGVPAGTRIMQINKGESARAPDDPACEFRAEEITPPDQQNRGGGARIHVIYDPR